MQHFCRLRNSAPQVSMCVSAGRRRLTAAPPNPTRCPDFPPSPIFSNYFRFFTAGFPSIHQSARYFRLLAVWKLTFKQWRNPFPKNTSTFFFLPLCSVLKTWFIKTQIPNNFLSHVWRTDKSRSVQTEYLPVLLSPRFLCIHHHPRSQFCILTSFTFSTLCSERKKQMCPKI